MDPDRWRASAHYDARAEVYSEVVAPPASIGIDFARLAKDGTASIAAASDGGAWIGTPQGLHYVSAQGGWTTDADQGSDPGARPRDRAGWLWIATSDGLLVRKPTGETLRIGAAQGCAIVAPRLLVELPGDRMLVIGTDEAGRERIAFGKELAWVTYRALPEVRWDAATRRGAGAVVMGGGRVYRIGPADPSQVRPLAREGMRLVPVLGGPPSTAG